MTTTPKDGKPVAPQPYWVHLEKDGAVDKYYVHAFDELDAKEMAENLSTEITDREGWVVTDVRAA